MPQVITTQSVASGAGNAPKLLDQLRDAARTHGHMEAWAAEAADWCRRFVLFHGKRHPKDMGLAETMITTHVMEKAATRVRSPLDGVLA